MKSLSKTVVCAVALNLMACSQQREPVSSELGALLAAKADAAETPLAPAPAPAPAPASAPAPAPTPAPAPEPSASERDFGICKVSVTGDATASATSAGGGTTVGSEYWFSETELVSIVATKTEDPAKQAELLQKEVKTYLLQLHCGDKLARAIFKVADGTSKARFPLVPGKYRLADKPAPGEVGARFFVGDATPTIDGEAALEITTFDHDKIVGRFDAPTTFAGKHFRFQGSFDLACPSRTCGRPEAPPKPATP